ncbi:hypothetical protein LCE44_26560 [Vibrio harveyi]|uniref:hypothetical protein n=1 Tax=Vibrio harveyi group TaxID=717610 RepID=UPI003BF7368D
MKFYVLVTAVLLSGCSSLGSIMSDGELECIEPPQEFVTTKAGVEIELGVGEKSASLNAGASKEVKRIRVEQEDVDRFNAITSSLCKNYKSGLMTLSDYREKYDRAYNEMVGKKKVTTLTVKE